MPKHEDELRRAVAKFVKSRIEVSTLYQHKKGSTWKKSNIKKRWSKNAKIIAVINFANLTKGIV